MSSFSYQVLLIHKTMKVHLKLAGIDLSCNESQCVELKHSSQIIENLRFNESVNLTHHLEEIFIERLSIPYTQVLEYLGNTYLMTLDEMKKTANQNNPNVQAFLSVIWNLALKYGFLSLSMNNDVGSNRELKSSFTGNFYLSHKIIVFLKATESYIFFENVVLSNLDTNKEFFNEISDYICDYLEAEASNHPAIDAKGNKIIKIITSLVECKLISEEKLGKILNTQNIDENGIEYNNLIGCLFGFDILPKIQNLIYISEYPLYDKILDYLDINKLTNQNIQIFRDTYYYYSIDLAKLLECLIKTDKQKSITFLNTILKLHSAKSNTEQDPRIPRYNTQFSDNFSYNLLTVLLEISFPFCNIKNESTEKIRPDYLQCESLFRSLLKDPIAPSILTSFKQEEITDTVNHYFYCTLFMLRFGYTSLKKLRALIIKKIDPQIINLIKGKKENHYHKVLIAYNFVLLDEYRNRRILNFYIFFFELVMKWNGFNGILPIESPSICMNLIPEYILKDFAGFAIFLCEKNCEVIFTINRDGPVDKILKFFTFLISNRKIFPNFKVINKFVSLFNMFFASKVLFRHADIFKINEVAQKYLMNSLFNYYAEVEKCPSGFEYTKLFYKENVFMLIKRLLKVEVFKHKMIEIQHTEAFSCFINIFFDEVTQSFENGISLLSNIKKLESMTRIGLNDYEQNLIKYSKVYWRKNNQSLSIIEIFCDLGLKVMVSDLLCKRLSAFLNQILKSFVGPDHKKININNPSYVNFKPKKTLETIIKIYVSFSKHDNFIETTTEIAILIIFRF